MPKYYQREPNDFLAFWERMTSAAMPVRRRHKVRQQARYYVGRHTRKSKHVKRARQIG